MEDIMSQEYQIELPEGEWEGRLLAKSQGRSNNIICFFEDVNNGNLYRISAFKSNYNDSYSAKDYVINFAENDIEGNVYLLKTGKNNNGNPAWFSAKLKK